MAFLPLCDDLILQCKFFFHIFLVILVCLIQLIVPVHQFFALSKEDQVSILELLLFTLFNFVKSLTHLIHLNVLQLDTVVSFSNPLLSFVRQVSILDHLGLLLIHDKLQAIYFKA